MNLTIDLINGLQVGIEYVASDPEDEEDYSLIVLNILFLRFIFIVA